VAITTAQRNAGAYQIILDMATEFPGECDAIAWIIVRAVKLGTATQKEIAKAILNGMVQAATGQDPTGNATLKHRVRHRLAEALTRFSDHNGGLNLADCFDAEAIVVT